MTSVYYFSGSGNSKSVAEYCSKRLNVSMIEIQQGMKAAGDTVVVIFPVYCQNIPPMVKAFLRSLNAKYVVLIALYGRISTGNVLCEAKKLTNATVIAAAYLPSGHSFLGEGLDFDLRRLDPIFGRIRVPQEANIPRRSKNLFAIIFPAWRSRVGVRIIRTSLCDNCGKCEYVCPMGAIKNGKIGSSCIRCLKCVNMCPNSALCVKKSKILSIYLRRKKKNDLIIYL